MAFIFGLIAARLKLPLLLGYLIAGMAVGPFTPGFVADQGLANQLSEIGVSLLMFGVGLHFSIKDLMAVRKIAIPGAVVQITAATVLGAVLAWTWGWPIGAGVVFGLSLSVASTVVLLRALGERRQLETVNGRVAVGWLIVEDLVTVLALVALPALAGALGGGESNAGSSENVYASLLWTLTKVSAFVAAMFLVGKSVIPRLLGGVARMGHRELFTLGVLAIALGVAFGAAALFGISPALGAFFAGVIISESDLSHQAGAETLPLQEAFTVLFFVSVGMLFDPSVLIDQPLRVLAVLFIVMVGKSLAAAMIVLAFRYPIATALTISASLAQIGEFSFILIGLGIQLEIVPSEARSIVLAAAILSITFNHLIFNTIAPIDRWLRRRPTLLGILERRSNGETPAPEQEPSVDNHVIMIGYGRVGATIGSALTQNEIPYIVVEQDRVVIDELQGKGIKTVFGDAARPGILSHAGLKNARLLIVATPGRSQAREIILHAKEVNPDIAVCVRTHSFEETKFFESLGVERTVMGEMELALQMAHYTLTALGCSEGIADQTEDSLRINSTV